MTAERPKNARRNGDLAMIHMAAKQLFGDVSKGSEGRGSYEDWLHRLTGKRSAGALTVDERIELIKRLRKDGLIKDRARGGAGRTVGGDNRPTGPQWANLGALARAMGWAGLEDPAFKSFVKRTAKIESTRFLTRGQASSVILGLEQWIGQRGGDAVS